MKIEREPVAPPPKIVMTFSADEGWVVAASLKMFAHDHPNAVHRADWLAWAKELDEELRR